MEWYDFNKTRLQQQSREYYRNLLEKGKEKKENIQEKHMRMCLNKKKKNYVRSHYKTRGLNSLS